MSQHAIPLADTADLGRLARRTTIVRVGAAAGDRSPRSGSASSRARGSTSARRRCSAPARAASSCSTSPPAPTRRRRARSPGCSATSRTPAGARASSCSPTSPTRRSRSARPPRSCGRFFATSAGPRFRPHRCRRERPLHAPAADHAPRDPVVALVPVGNPDLRRARERPPDGARGALARQRRAPRQRPQRLAVRHRLPRADAATLQARRDPPPHRGAPPDRREPRLLREQGREERVRRAGRVRRRAHGAVGPAARGRHARGR